MFGELTRAHRRRQGITQEELAERTGLSARAIRAIETGRSAVPRQVTVRLLADAFALTGAERDRYLQAASSRRPGPAPEGSPPVPDGFSPLRAGSAPAWGGTVPVWGGTVPVWGGTVPVTAPRQLPVAVPGFAGRTAQLERLTALLDAGGPTTVVVSGTGGVGKSTLAVHWAHQVAPGFPDGQLFVNLGGFAPAGAMVDPGEAVRGFLHALGVPTTQVPPDLAGQAALYRSLLARRRMLVVLDNARDAEQVRPLIPAAAGCLVLVTSRRQLTSLVAAEGAVPLPLDLPSAAEARLLLIGRLGEPRVAAEPAAVEALIARCARLPLALGVVAARAALRPGFSLTDLLAQLDGSGSRLDALHGGDAVSDARTVFSWSYDQLGEPAARLFRLLCLHPGPDIGGPGASGLAGHGLADVPEALTELTDAGLVNETAAGRYVLHDLMRSYAVELAERIDPEDDRRAGLHRLLDHYLRSARNADRLLAPGRCTPAPPPPVTGAAPVTFDEPGPAMAWFTAEIPVLLAVLRLADRSGFDDYVWQLASSLCTFLYRRGDRHEAVAVHRLGLGAALRLDDVVARTHSHYLLGRSLVDVDRYDEARDHLERARRGYDERGDTAGVARTEQTIGITFERQGDLHRAVHHLRLALDLARSAGDTALQGRFLNGIGWLNALLGDHAAARLSCEQALLLMEEIGDRDGMADAWDSLGFALHHLGDHAEAVTCYRRALALYSELGHRAYLAWTLTHLGESHRAAGHPEQAEQVWQDALEIFTALHHPERERLRRLIAGLRAQVSAAATAR